MKKILYLIIASFVLTACATSDLEESYPKTREEKEQDRIGKLTGEEGLIVLGGKSRSKATEGINVNSYLWRATLDTVHKMPIISADPFGGTVFTDWYMPKANANDRYKLNIFIIGGELRSDAIKVTAFKQEKRGGSWVDVSSSNVAANIGYELENKILERAREIKVAGSR